MWLGAGHWSGIQNHRPPFLSCGLVFTFNQPFLRFILSFYSVVVSLLVHVFYVRRDVRLLRKFLTDKTSDSKIRWTGEDPFRSPGV